MLKWYLRDAPLARKIQLGFGAIIAGVGVAGGYLALKVSAADEMVKDYRAIARTNNEAGDAEARYMEMRVAARDLVQGDAEARAVLRDGLRDATAAITTAHEQAPEGDIKTLVGQVPGLLERYADLAERAAVDPSLVPQRSAVAQELVRVFDEIDTAADAAQNTLGPVMRETLDGVRNLAIGMALLTLILGGALAALLSQIIGAPLRRATDAMEKLAGNDLSVLIEGADRGDCTGRMARALQTFKDNALEMERMRAEQEELKARAEEEKRAAMHALASGFEASVMAVVDAVAAASTELEASAASLSRTAGEAATRSDKVAQAAEVSAQNVQTVASASEEMAASASEIASQVSQANDVSRVAEQKARDADHTVRDLRAAAQRIGEVVDLITEIASQTNLLALNATIEAARAGEAGRGFAVVAAEVKRLAEQTAKATDEIATQVSGIQNATDGAVHALGAISTTIGEINQISMAISASVEEQTAAVREISRNTAEVAEGTRDVGQSIGFVREGAAETGAAAEQSLGAAKELGVQSNLLRDEVRRFIAQIRAA